MRTKAFILFFPFAIFLFETASFIPAMIDNCSIVVSKQNACSKPQPERSCGKIKEKNTCGQAKQKKGSDKKSADNCENNPDCTTCPVCYTFICQQQYECPVHHFTFKKNYSLLNSDFNSAFTTSVWKPPNTFLYS